MNEFTLHYILVKFTGPLGGNEFHVLGLEPGPDTVAVRGPDARADGAEVGVVVGTELWGPWAHADADGSER